MIDRAIIKRLLCQSGLVYPVDSVAMGCIIRFAEAIAAHEREACAVACVDFAVSHPFDEDYRTVIYDCADAVRGRANAVS